MEFSKLRSLDEFIQLHIKGCEYLGDGWSKTYKRDEFEALYNKDTPNKRKERIIMKIFKSKTLGEMRAEMELYGIKFSDSGFNAMTPREIQRAVREARRVWKRVNAMETFVREKEEQANIVE